MKIKLLKREDLEETWPKVEGYLKEGLAHANGEANIDTIKTDLINGDLVILACHEGEEITGAVTMISDTFGTGKSILTIATMGGDSIEHLSEMLRTVEGLAKINKHEEVYISGRPAWVRLLKPYGYNHQHTVVSKRVG